MGVLWAYTDSLFVKSAEVVAVYGEGASVLNGLSAADIGECIGCLLYDCPAADDLVTYDGARRGEANAFTECDAHEYTRLGAAGHSHGCESHAAYGSVGVDCNYLCKARATRECVN